MYGFKTTKKVTLLKAEEEDLKNIIRLYNPKDPSERRLITENWKEALKREKDDYNNFTMVIRDKCQKVIGLVSFETANKKDFNIDVWIPSVAKKQAYFQHVVESLVEWVEDYTDVSRISHLRELKGNPRDCKYEVLKENYEIAV